MVYSFARVSAVVGMHVEDYYQNGKRWWIRLHEKGGKFHEVPAHHKAEAYLDAYIRTAGIGGDAKGPLFRTAVGKSGQLTQNTMSRREPVSFQTASSTLAVFFVSSAPGPLHPIAHAFKLG